MATAGHKPQFSEPNPIPKNFVFHKLLLHNWAQFFKVHIPSFFFFLASLSIMLDLSCPTRDQTQALLSESIQF